MAPDRFVSDDALVRYRSLCLRGFCPQRIIHVHVLAFHSIMNLIDSVGWRTTVTNVPAFSPILVREFLSNLGDLNSTVRIRDEIYQITSTVVNQTFNTPDGGDSKNLILIGGLCNQWKYFSIKDLCPVYRHAYEVCRSNWIPREEEDRIFSSVPNC